MNLASAISIHSAALFQGVQITGFTCPEEEMIRAMISRVPPELLKNVTKIVADRTLGAKHGRYVPETKTININPGKFSLRQRFGKGQGWIQHIELTMIHEVGHSVFHFLPEEKRTAWLKISGWVKGESEGNLPPYVEKRPGWEKGKTSDWTHKPGVEFTRHYAERNPDEDFADSFAFYVLNKGHQMAPKKRAFINSIMQSLVKKYPQPSIQSPMKPYGERG